MKFIRKLIGYTTMLCLLWNAAMGQPVTIDLSTIPEVVAKDDSIQRLLKENEGLKRRMNMMDDRMRKAAQDAEKSRMEQEQNRNARNLLEKDLKEKEYELLAEQEKNRSLEKENQEIYSDLKRLRSQQKDGIKDKYHQEKEIKLLQKQLARREREIDKLRYDTTILHRRLRESQTAIHPGPPIFENPPVLVEEPHTNLPDTTNRSESSRELQRLHDQVSKLVKKDSLFHPKRFITNRLQSRIQAQETSGLLSSEEQVQLFQIKKEFEIYLNACHAVQEAKDLLRRSVDSLPTEPPMLRKTFLPQNPHFGKIRTWLLSDIFFYKDRTKSVYSFMNDFHQLVNEQLPERIDRFIETQDKIRPSDHPWTWQISYPFLAKQLGIFKKAALVAIEKGETTIEIPN